jgi:RND family efflux transporter MFP subunit
MQLIRIRYLLLLILLTLATACRAGSPGGAGNPTPTPVPPEPGVEQPTYTVQRGTVARELEFTARVAPVQQADLFFRADGYLSRLLVQRDQNVQEGDLLAELEMADLQRELEAAQLDWQQAQVESRRQISRTHMALQEAELALQRATALDATVVQARVELTRSREALTRAQAAYDQAWDPARDWEMYMRDPTPRYPGEDPPTGTPLADKLKAERESTERALKEAQYALKVAQANYDDAIQGRSYELRQLELDVTKARLDYEAALDGPSPRLEQKVQQLEAREAEHRITAPFDGVVLSLSATPGDSISAYQTVLAVGDPSELELRADLSAEQVSDLTVGMTVTLAPADYPGQTFAGEVRQLPYGWGQEAEETDRATHITLPPDVTDLELGALVRATIVLEEREDVLWLPPSALQTFQGRTFVIVEEPDGTQRRVDVTTGIEGEERVEIVSGLEEGQTVVGP